MVQFRVLLIALGLLIAINATGCSTQTEGCTGTGCVVEDGGPVSLCSGRVCGPNSDGVGSCGDCAGGQTCNNGQCVAGGNDAGRCTPNCSGRSCGSDGCSGTCAPGCAAGQSCDPSGRCGATPACTPGATAACACPGGASGTQTCNSTGTGFGTCTCANPCVGRVCGPDGAGGSCGSCLTGQACNAAGACVAATVDCSTATSCGTCSPLAGCGWCGATSTCVRVNAACTGPATGTCPGRWACNPADCAASMTACAPCTSDAQCPGSFCGRRTCDGRSACAPTGGMAACETVGGVACPTVSAYRVCSSSLQCGPGSACVPVYPGDTTTVCQASCTTHADCPPVPAGFPGVLEFCYTTIGRCVLSCDRAGMCTSDGLSCRRAQDGAYAYCR